jgi:hypothetical protein
VEVVVEKHLVVLPFLVDLVVEVDQALVQM